MPPLLLPSHPAVAGAGAHMAQGGHLCLPETPFARLCLSGLQMLKNIHPHSCPCLAFGHLERNLPPAFEEPHHLLVSPVMAWEQGWKLFKQPLSCSTIFQPFPQATLGETLQVVGGLGGSWHVPSWVSKHQTRAGVVLFKHQQPWPNSMRAGGQTSKRGFWRTEAPLQTPYMPPAP